MSGTAASYFAGGGASGLPAPVVRLGKNFGGVVYQCADGVPNGGNVFDVTPANVASVSVHGLPQAVMDDLDAFRPQLELLRYIATRSRQQQRGRSWTTGGYVHPSHGPGASGNGSHTHGGAQSSTPGTIQAIRPTEWLVTNWGQVIDVTQGMHGFMNSEFIGYREYTAGAVQITNQIEALTPSGSRGGSTGSTGYGRRFPYHRRFRPGYFRFRWSIIDPTDSRGQRITGPLSDTVSLSNEIFPFRPDQAWLDPVGGDYHATATVDPRFDKKVTRMWVGSVSRLPR